MAYLDRMKACNNGDMSRYVPFHGRGAHLGWVREDRLSVLEAYPDIFVFLGTRVALHDRLDDVDSATDGVDTAMRDLRLKGRLPSWREERYAVSRRFGGEPLLSIERAACPLLGIRSWGFHLNAYVRRPDGLYLWIAERAHDKTTYPGLLDNTVAGGQPEGLTLAQNVVKECAEEASLGAEIAARATPVGVMSYRHETEEGLKPDEMFCFDLELSEDEVPEPSDGEVHAFHLLPAAEVMAIVRDTERFKFNCAAVLIYFFVRHGLIDPDLEADYTALCSSFNLGNRPAF